jgi:soluble epoxide hydrolase/lipid-phosphate phosphatase
VADITHRTIETNGIRMHVAEAGPQSGFPVVFCHGWPELWYSWRHQVHALADAGFRAIAPDMRGFGDTTAPADPAEYTMKTICADMDGLLKQLGIPRAVFVGHDWGGAVIWQMGLRYPEKVERLVGLNTPYAPPSGARTTEALRDFHGQTDKTFYMRYFLQPGVAEAEFEEDVATTFKKLFVPYTRYQDFASFMTVGGDGSGAIRRITRTDTFLDEAELAEYVRVYSRTGFRGGLNWYRAADMNADEVDGPKGPQLHIKSMMVTAGKDTILKPEMAAAMPMLIPGIRMEHIENCGHWTQQECPAQVNALLIDFLGDLRTP